MALSSDVTILFAAGDPGGARAVWECYSTFKAKHFECLILKHGWMNEFAKSTLPTLVPPSSVSEIEYWLKLNCIDVVIFGTSLVDPLPLSIARCAGNLNLLTICVLDNWMNYRERLESDQYPFFIPTIYAVMDSFAAQCAIDAGIPASCIYITGHPALSNLNSQYVKSIKNSNSLKTKQTILFVSEPVSEDQGDTTSSPHFRGYTQYQVLQLVCNALQPFHDKINLILQPHPRDNVKKLFQFWSQCKGKIDGEISTFDSGRDAIFLSDRVIGMASILLYEAWLIGKPVMSVQPNLMNNDLKTIANRNNVFFVDDINFLDYMINQWITVGSFQPRPELKLHSSAAENIASLATSLFKRHL